MSGMVAIDGSNEQGMNLLFYSRDNEGVFQIDDGR